VNGLDPVLARRARIARLVSLGKGIGYACFAAALVLFFVGLLSRFTGLVSTLTIALLLGGCVFLPPAIVFGYGLRAAEREEREADAAREARGPRATEAGSDPSAPGPGPTTSGGRPPVEG
jgi:hypothetical protein